MNRSIKATTLLDKEAYIKHLNITKPGESADALIAGGVAVLLLGGYMTYAYQSALLPLMLATVIAGMFFIVNGYIAQLQSKHSYGSELDPDDYIAIDEFCNMHPAARMVIEKRKKNNGTGVIRYEELDDLLIGLNAAAQKAAVERVRSSYG